MRVDDVEVPLGQEFEGEVGDEHQVGQFGVLTLSYEGALGLQAGEMSIP